MPRRRAGFSLPQYWRFTIWARRVCSSAAANMKPMVTVALNGDGPITLDVPDGRGVGHRLLPQHLPDIRDLIPRRSSAAPATRDDPGGMQIIRMPVRIAFDSRGRYREMSSKTRYAYADMRVE